MSGRVRGHIRANVYGLIAVFIALGGTSIAATQIARNSVGSKAIKTAAVKNKEIADDAVTGAKVADGSLTGSDLDLATLGAVPGAAHATTADEAEHATTAGEAEHATTAGEAANALQLGGLAPADYQRRVTGDCSAGNAIRTIDASGGVTCEPSGAGTITGVSVSGGLTGGGTSGDVSVGTDPTVVQQRVTGTCGGNTAINSVFQNGTVTCSSSFVPAGRVLSSGRVNVAQAGTPTLVQAGGITIAAACGAFAGEADVTLAGNDISFVGDTISEAGGHIVATNFSSLGAVIGRTTDFDQLLFSAVSGTGTSLNGQVLMIRNGDNTCTYAATAISGG